jgi:hypothetical protein
VDCAARDEAARIEDLSLWLDSTLTVDKFPCLDFRRHAIDTRCRYGGPGPTGRRA